MSQFHNWVKKRGTRCIELIFCCCDEWCMRVTIVGSLMFSFCSIAVVLYNLCLVLRRMYVCIFVYTNLPQHFFKSYIISVCETAASISILSIGGPYLLLETMDGRLIYNFRVNPFA